MQLAAVTLRDVINLVLLILLVGGFVVLTIKKSEDPWRMIFNWIITAIIIAFIVWKALPLFDNGGMDSMIGLAYIMAGGSGFMIICRGRTAPPRARPPAPPSDRGSP